MSEAGPSRPRLRANKACENCRLRKTRCSGITPCEPCKSAGIEGQCFVRNKARPNRLVTNHYIDDYAHLRPAPAIIARARVDASEDRDISRLPRPSDNRESRGPVTASIASSPRLNPLEYLKEFVQQWGTENGVSLPIRSTIHSAKSDQGSTRSYFYFTTVPA